MWPALIVCAVAVTVVLWAEARGRAALSGAAKVVASGAFIAAALVEGAPATILGQSLLIALGWSALGDVLLVPRDNRPAFLFGMVAFAIAHVGYAFHFHLIGVDGLGVAIGGAVAGLAGLAFFRWLRPRLARRAPGMTGPVVGYLLVITLMVAMSAGALVRAPSVAWLGFVAALTFWLSDVTVAIVRLAGGHRAWRIVGLPLYYAAQLLFVAALP